MQDAVGAVEGEELVVGAAASFEGDDLDEEREQEQSQKSGPLEESLRVSEEEATMGCDTEKVLKTIDSTGRGRLGAEVKVRISSRAWAVPRTFAVGTSK